MNRVIAAATAAACAAGFAASTARAQISLGFQAVPITATSDGVTPPPGIAGYQSFDFTITLAPGYDFTEARVFWDAPGTIFQHALGDNNPTTFGPPNSALFAAFPALEFDSYLRGPSDSVLVYGAFDGTNVLPPPGVFNSDRIAVAFRDFQVTPGFGTYPLMRLTYDGPSPVLGVTMFVQLFAVEIPEPVALGLLAVVGVAFVRPRRRRRRR